MRIYDRSWPAFAIVERMRKIARAGAFDGTAIAGNAIYLDACKGVEARSGTVMIFSRDTGHHTSGWWKNPDYERCLHLSVSFVDPITSMTRPYDHKVAEEWAGRFFGESLRLAWIEPPAFPEGKAREVHHYRVFCDEHWQPIRPRGEVYSTELTEAGWKSFSEVEAERQATVPA